MFQLAPGDDAMLSHMYSLLDYISATSRLSGLDNIAEIIEGTGGQADYATLHPVESTLRGLTEEEKRLIAVSTISVVSRLAVEFEDDEVRSISNAMILESQYHCPGDTFDSFDVVATPTVCGTNRKSSDRFQPCRSCPLRS